MRRKSAVVPGYYLVCYNKLTQPQAEEQAVVPGYYLVCYNQLNFFGMAR